MAASQLESEDNRREDAELEKENMNRTILAQDEKAMSTTIVCGKCKCNKVAYWQARIRSVDGPINTFCECTVCGHRWRLS